MHLQQQQQSRQHNTHLMIISFRVQMWPPLEHRQGIQLESALNVAAVQLVECSTRDPILEVSNLKTHNE
jgi:hypothetical protein